MTTDTAQDLELS